MWSKCSRLHFKVGEMRALMVVLTTECLFPVKFLQVLEFVCLENFLLASPGAALLPTALTKAGDETPSSLVSLHSFNPGIKSWFWRLECKQYRCFNNNSVYYLFIYLHILFFSNFFHYLSLSISTYCCLLLSSHNPVKFLFINMYQLRHCLLQ